MIVLFDLDSTIARIEWCDRLAQRKWVGKQVADITKATMDGEMNFDQAFVGKTNMVAPSIAEQEELWREYNQNLDIWISQLISILVNEWHKVWILTQWYRIAALIVAKYLWISEEMVFGLEFDYDESGNYAYFPDQTLKYESGKKNTVTKLRTKFPEEKFAVIGDSVSDLHAGEAADLFVWYGWTVVREKVKASAIYFAYDGEELLGIIQSYWANLSI